MLNNFRLLESKLSEIIYLHYSYIMNDNIVGLQQQFPSTELNVTFLFGEGKKIHLATSRKGGAFLSEI